MFDPIHVSPFHVADSPLLESSILSQNWYRIFYLHTCTSNRKSTHYRLEESGVKQAPGSMSKQRQSQDQDGRAASRTQAGQLRPLAPARQDAYTTALNPSHITPAASSVRNGRLPPVEASRRPPQLIPGHSHSVGGTAMAPSHAHSSGRRLAVEYPLIDHPQRITTGRATADQQNRQLLSSPHTGTFTGPAGSWRAYNRREVDAYHGLLSLRYGPMVEATSASYNMTTRQASGGRSGNVPAQFMGAATNARQVRPKVHDSDSIMGSSRQSLRPVKPQAAHKQTPSPASQGEGGGQDARRVRDPPRRYSCYMCEWTGLGFSWARNHMLRRHGLNESEMDYQRIQASEVVCLW
ncbi:hypothetical protein EDD36DRAFT_423285 [Exophiala viscosa]|uniref:Uncharacterized protein n=1 Tax=Exophiala viscosa TaxID=2486360 RepID=A0AAN6DMR7_9EURO|nr:hypothetical protein EDD36DRAFT_423285 [Exophiala viscosa]